MAIQPKNTTQIKVDYISEKTAAAGIRLDDPVTCDESLSLTAGDVTLAGSGYGVVLNGDATFACAGTTQGTATAMTKMVTMITSCVAGVTDGAILPDATLFKEYLVINESGAIAKIYPQSGLNIDDGAADAAYSLADNARRKFMRITSTRWISY